MLIFVHAQPMKTFSAIWSLFSGTPALPHHSDEQITRLRFRNLNLLFGAGIVAVLLLVFSLINHEYAIFMASVCLGVCAAYFGFIYAKKYDIAWKILLITTPVLVVSIPFLFGHFYPVVVLLVFSLSMVLFLFEQSLTRNLFFIYHAIALTAFILLSLPLEAALLYLPEVANVAVPLLCLLLTFSIHNYYYQDQLWKERQHTTRRNYLAQLFDLNPHMIFVKNTKGEITYANRSFASFLGIEREELKGKSASELQLESFEALHFNNSDWEVLLNLKPQYIPSEIATDANGERKFLQIYKSPVFSGHEEVQEVLCVSADVTGLVMQEGESGVLEAPMKMIKNDLLESPETKTLLKSRVG